jgi:hypothetical protein
MAMPMAATTARMGLFSPGHRAELKWTYMWGFVVNVMFLIRQKEKVALEHSLLTRFGHEP